MFLLLFLATTVVHAEDVITLYKGEAAPFTGTLLSPEAAAKIIVDSDYSIERCKIEAERDLALQEARLTLAFNNKESEFAACTLRSVEMAKIYEEQIKFLEKQAVKPRWQTPVYFTAGIITGVGIMYGASLMLQNIGD